MTISGRDKTNGYEEMAERFMQARNPRIGADTVLEWSKRLAPGSSILDLGCGHGVPISQTLSEAGFAIYCVDASAKMIQTFRKRFPTAKAECSAVEESEFFGRTFDGIVAWGLLFLLPADLQSAVVHKVAKGLNPSGNFLFTSPREAVQWQDALTGRESVSLGAGRYRQLLQAEGLILVGEASDEGDNYYYLARKP